MISMRPTFAEINLSNLKYNYLNIRKKVNDSKIMAVVKADAYGHGMIECVKKLSSIKSGGPEYYGVALTEEGIELRKANIIDEPILTFSPFQKNELDDYLKYKIMPTISSEHQINLLKRNLKQRELRIHINIDTGMGRLGINYEKAYESIKAISSIPTVKIDGVYTHFATSDEKDKSFAKLQLKRFNEVIKLLKTDKIKYGILHAANSGAILDMPESYFDMVRPGITLYGYYPSLGTTKSIALKPVMSLFSRVSTVRELRSGESTSYGRKFFANKKSNIVSVPIGYADGLNRLLINKMKVIVKDKVFDQIGTVTMDRVMINTKNKKLKVGDKVILLGKSKNNSITAWDWSKIIKTIPYEITCNINKRVPRIYINQ